jgi:hypothetical protein
VKFARRIQLYLFGFILGSVLVYFGLIRNRPDDSLTSWLPQNRIILQLDTNKLVLATKAECYMNCQGLKPEELKMLIHHGEVNFSKSEVHAKPYPKYAIEGKTLSGKQMRLFCEAFPAETHLLSLVNFGITQDTCHCQ